MITKSTKNYHLPTIITKDGDNFRRNVSSSYHRHTLDLSYTIEDYHTPNIRRTNSLFNNNSSIFSTFTPLTNKESLSSSACSITSIVSSSSSSSSSSSYSSGKKINATETDHDILLQKKLWQEDETICSKQEIAQWLGSK